MYKIYISGTGAEITQGSLPIDIVEQIKEEVAESNLASYFLDSLDSEDKLNWYDVDDNFHSYGAWFNDSELIVEDSNGNIIFKEACFKLNFHTSQTKELYPEDFKFEPIGVLTCIEQLKGKFCIVDLDTELFDPSKLHIYVDALGDKFIVSSISYDNTEFEDLVSEIISKDFIAHLEN